MFRPDFKDCAISSKMFYPMERYQYTTDRSGLRQNTIKTSTRKS